MKTINILGDTQREQWHNVVNMLRQYGGMFTDEARSQLCDELDRYIDAMEDANEQTEQDTADNRALCDRNGNRPRTAEEQEAIVRWAVRNRAVALDAIKYSAWEDEQDKDDFGVIVCPVADPGEYTAEQIAEFALNTYWSLDTLAREVFIEEMEKIMPAKPGGREHTVYVLISKTYCDTELTVDVRLYETAERARCDMRIGYDETLDLWQFDLEQENEYHRTAWSRDRARIDDYTDFAEWIIEPRTLVEE